jgi:MFS family permease
VLLRPVIGRGIDNRGRRPFLVGAMALLAVTSPLFALAGSVPAVIALRVAQGAVGAAFYTTAAAVTTDLAGPERRASAIARFSLFLYGGFAIGPGLAEQLVERVSFPAVWSTAAALGAVGVVCILLLPESGGSVMARRAELGKAARRLLHPAAVGPGLVLMTTGMGYASITGFSSLYAREVGLTSAGALYATFAVTILVTRLVSGSLADRYGRVAIALPGLGLGATGLALLALVQLPVTAFIGVAVFGMGFSLIFPALMAFTVDRVEDHERGEALGSFTAFMDIGTGGGAYLIGVIAERAGFAAAYGTPAVLCAGGAALLVVLARRGPAPGDGTGTLDAAGGR